MHLSVFIRKLASVLGLAFIITSGWLWYVTGNFTGNGAINRAKDSLSHSSSNTLSKSVPSPSVNSDQSTMSDDSNLQQLTQGLHPEPSDPIPDVKDVHELPVVDISFYNMRDNLISGWLAIHSPLVPVIILTHGTPGNRVSMIQRAAFLYNHGYNVLLFDFQSYGRSQGIM